MEVTLLTRVVLPVAIVVIMLGLGLTLAVQDFRRIARYPRVVALGLTFQLAVLPLVAYMVVHLFGMNPVLAMGLMILALSPAGATSNMISYLCRGDLALAVTLTALAITLGIEVGVHNGTMALFVTGTLLNNPEMSIAPAIYSLIMFVTAAAYGYLVNAGRSQQADLAPPV
ncbi:MAG: hypothetical protein M3373_14335 [Gemmatimonadota bacterium]|nr:hypothetical protein [Gemmatimonadota bacterium]